MSEIHLESGYFITFDKRYVDYSEYEYFTKEGVFYVTRLKYNGGNSYTNKNGNIKTRCFLQYRGLLLKIENIISYYQQYTRF
jgi:hypothetical protein